jgi:hypothetical protein
MSERTKYVHPSGFRYAGKIIGRLPNRKSPEFAAVYDRLLAEVLAGRHGKSPGKVGRPSGMLKPRKVGRRRRWSKASCSIDTR